MRFPKLIASDLDGTLLVESSNHISETAIELIREYISRGGIFVAASGRQPENMFDIFAPIKDEIGYSCYSGGLCIYRGETVFEKTFDPALAKELISDIEDSESYEAMVSIRGAELISPKEPSLYGFMTDSIGAYTTVVNDLKTAREGIFKISLHNKDGVIDRDYWKRRYGSRCTVLDSGRVWMDFIPTGVNKGTSLSALLEHLGISPEDCVAFGDNENDKHMLSLVGCPIVMEHSSEKIKALGEYTTDTVENALKKILEET